MKNGLAVFVSGAVLSASVWAGPTGAQRILGEADNAFLFKDASVCRVAVLSVAEMEETEGKLIQFAIPFLYSAAAGLGLYFGSSQLLSLPVSWQGATFAAVTSGLTGGIGILSSQALGNTLAAQVAMKGNMALKNLAIQQISPYNQFGRVK